MLLFEYLLCARYSSRHFYVRFSCVSPLSLNEVIFFFFFNSGIRDEETGSGS